MLYIQTYSQFIVDRELNIEFQLNTAIDLLFVVCCIIECASHYIAPIISIHVYYICIYGVSALMNQVNKFPSKYEIILQFMPPFHRSIALLHSRMVMCVHCLCIGIFSAHYLFLRFFFGPIGPHIMCIMSDFWIDFYCGYQWYSHGLCPNHSSFIISFLPTFVKVEWFLSNGKNFESETVNEINWINAIKLFI